MNCETTIEIEYAIACHLGWRQNIIVPNISWGANVHECDLFVLSKSGWATEIEIKVSAGDLKKDASKGHGHRSNKIRYLYFAIPKKLLKHWKHIPVRAGIYIVDEKGGVHKLRAAEKNKDARSLTADEIANIARLGVMRYWSGRNSATAVQGELNRLRNQLGKGHQEKVFNITYHRDKFEALREIKPDDRTSDWKWHRRYHRDRLIEAVKLL